jgi:ABC-2 type transport system permease protein
MATTTGHLTMIDLVRNEFLKLRTIRTPLVLLAAAQLVVVIGVSGLFVQGADPTDIVTVQRALAHVGVASFFSLVLGIVAMAGEYRHKTITDTFLATPARGRVVGAKMITAGVAGAAIGIVSAATAFATSAIWLAAKDAVFDLSAGDVWRTVLGCIVWNVCFGAVGVGVGALARNLSGAVTGALVWIAVVEGLVGQLVGDMARWLPFRSGLALEALPASDAQLSQWGGGLMLLAYAAVFVTAALATSVRRDVT